MRMQHCVLKGFGGTVLFASFVLLTCCRKFRLSEVPFSQDALNMKSPRA